MRIFTTWEKLTGHCFEEVQYMLLPIFMKICIEFSKIPKLLRSSKLFRKNVKEIRILCFHSNKGLYGFSVCILKLGKQIFC